MKFLASFSLKLRKHISSFLKEPDNMLINWSDFSKGKLIAFFGLLSQFGALKWYLLSYYSLENNRWIDSEFFKLRVISVTLCGVVFSVIFVLCFVIENNKKFRIFVAYFTPAFFGLSMIYNGYTIGIYSPATMAGYISIVLLGLVFYSRKILYSIAAPILVFTAIACYFTSNGMLRYAPVFSQELNDSIVYKNTFWLASMAELYIPIMIVSVLIFEILLTQWRNREQYFELGSKFDSLTNLFNRRHITDVLTRLEKFKLNEYAVILLDLDYFKSINDQYGHDAGDLVLQRVAEILKFNTRESDVVGRFGGEEFIFILNYKHSDEVVDVAERCRIQIQNQVIVLKCMTQINISASFGIAFSKDGASKEAVIRQADQALYLAKEQGRNRVQVYCD